MSFAEHLRQIRKEKGLSQEDLAELLDVSRQAVSKWEQGAGYPEVETAFITVKPAEHFPGQPDGYGNCQGGRRREGRGDRDNLDHVASRKCGRQLL